MFRIFVLIGTLAGQPIDVLKSPYTFDTREACDAVREERLEKDVKPALLQMNAMVMASKCATDAEMKTDGGRDASSD